MSHTITKPRDQDCSDVMTFPISSFVQIRTSASTNSKATITGYTSTDTNGDVFVYSAGEVYYESTTSGDTATLTTGLGAPIEEIVPDWVSTDGKTQYLYASATGTDSADLEPVETATEVIVQEDWTATVSNTEYVYPSATGASLDDLAGAGTPQSNGNLNITCETSAGSPLSSDVTLVINQVRGYGGFCEQSNGDGSECTTLGSKNSATISICGGPVGGTCEEVAGAITQVQQECEKTIDGDLRVGGKFDIGWDSRVEVF